ncbi:MAG: N-acetyltransferase [Bacteroidales bacterium]|nr:N-acetyltransferase [Bacteroidales bacterium]
MIDGKINGINTQVSVRAATHDDAAFIAQCVYMAFLVDLEQFDTPKQHELLMAMKAVSERNDTLYSWCNAFIATYNGECVGMTLCYEGSRYMAMKEITMSLLCSFANDVFGKGFDEMSDETMTGEYYVDSLVVLPSFREQGIGRFLLQHCVETADSLGLTCTLLVAPDNIRAQYLYESVGFRKSGQVWAFNEQYDRMYLTTKP